MEKSDFKDINDYEYDLVKKAVNDEKVEILTVFLKKPYDEVYLPDPKNYAKIWNENIDRINAMPKYNSYMRYVFAAASLFLLIGPFFLFTQNDGDVQDWTRHIVSAVAAGFAFFLAAYDTKLTYENRKKFRYNMILQDAFGNNAIALRGDTLFTLSGDDDLDEIKILDLQSINYAPGAESSSLILITNDNESYTYDDLKGPGDTTTKDLVKKIKNHGS